MLFDNLGRYEIVLNSFLSMSVSLCKIIQLCWLEREKIKRENGNQYVFTFAFQQRALVSKSRFIHAFDSIYFQEWPMKNFAFLKIVESLKYLLQSLPS